MSRPRTPAPDGRNPEAEQAHMLKWALALPAGLPSPQLIADACKLTRGVVKAILAAPDKTHHRRATAAQLDAVRPVLEAYGYRQA